MAGDTVVNGEAVTVDDARSDDLDALSALFNDFRVFYGCARDPDGARRFVTRMLDERSTRFFCAKLRGALAGFVHLLPSFETLAMRNAWVLEDLFVHPAYRRRGAGAALMQRAEAFARSTGASRLSLATAHTNVTAQRLYEAHGYRVDDVFRTYHLELAP